MTFAASDGETRSEETLKAARFVVTGDRLTVSHEGTRREVTVRLDPAERPVRIDLVPAGEDGAETQPGVYRFDGEELVVCLSQGRSRPTAFASKPGKTPDVLIRFARTTKCPGLAGWRDRAQDERGDPGGGMSTGVDVYLVPAEELRAAPGSKDPRLLAAAPDHEFLFGAVDALARHRDEDEDRPPRARQAYEQIVNGGPYDRGFGYVYGYAYQALCATVGTAVDPGWHQLVKTRDWFPALDVALAALGADLRVSDLVGRGPLIRIPEPDDFPGLGWWTADEVAAAARALRGLDLAGAGPLAGDLEDVRSWVEAAAGRPGYWLVGVHA